VVFYKSIKSLNTALKMKTYKWMRSLLFLCSFILLHERSEAQNIRGDTIHVDTKSVVAIVFPSSPTKAELSAMDGSYEVNGIGKKSLSIIAKKNEAKDQTLEVTEGKRNHLFVLAYKDGSPARSVDWSNIKKLKAHVEENKRNASKVLLEADALYKQTLGNVNDERAWEKVVDKYQQLTNLIDAKNESFVKARLVECRKRVQDIREANFKTAMKEGQDLFFATKFAGSIKAYEKALDYKPGDEQALKNIGLVKEEWGKDLVKKGDEEMKLKDYVSAKAHYGMARDLKPADTALQNKLNKAKKYADPLIVKKQKEAGDQAYQISDWKGAREAYNSALAAATNERDTRYLISQLKKLNHESDYERIRVKANSLAATASIEEIDSVIKELEKVAQLFPARNYPKNKIKELKIQRDSIKKEQTAERKKS
jgi:hypothetical protein